MKVCHKAVNDEKCCKTLIFAFLDDFCLISLNFRDLSWISAAERKIAPEAEKKIIPRESLFETSFLIILRRYLAENREKKFPQCYLRSDLVLKSLTTGGPRSASRQ